MEIRSSVEISIADIDLKMHQDTEGAFHLNVWCDGHCEDEYIPPVERTLEK